MKDKFTILPEKRFIDVEKQRCEADIKHRTEQYCTCDEADNYMRTDFCERCHKELRHR